MNPWRAYAMATGEEIARSKTRRGLLEAISKPQRKYRAELWVTKNGKRVEVYKGRAYDRESLRIHLQVQWKHRREKWWRQAAKIVTKAGLTPP